MRACVNHEIDNDPEPEHAGTIMVTATIFVDDDNFNPPFTTTSLPISDFFDYESQTRQELESFLLESEIGEDVIADAMLNLVVHVYDVTCPTSRCALEVQLDLFPEFFDDDDTFEEVFQVSFDQSINNTQLRPASKLAVKSLTRKVYNKKIKKEKRDKKIKKEKRNKKEVYKKSSLEECTICLQEFSNGGTIVTLPCGHDFDDECIVKWFETSHVCPLCRFELPCGRPIYKF